MQKFVSKMLKDFAFLVFILILVPPRILSNSLVTTDKHPLPQTLKGNVAVKNDADGGLGGYYTGLVDWVKDKVGLGVPSIQTALSTGLHEFEVEIDQVKEKIIAGDPNLIRYYLHSNPRNKDYYEEIIFKNLTSLRKAHYRLHQPWKILIHGYTNDLYGKFPQNVKNAYLQEYSDRVKKNRNPEAYNVLIVDWGALADPKNFDNSTAAFVLYYSFAVNNVPIVGVRVGEFIQFLKENGAVESYSKVHLVGFSLGAHVSGIAGQTVFKNTKEKVGRISGIDPAGPNFYLGLNLKGISQRQLSDDDAYYVDVYHSNQGALGTLKDLGHSNFYINGGGPIQPFCYEQYSLKTGNESFTDMITSCSHNMGPVYFAGSISTAKPPVLACNCASLITFKTTCSCSEKAPFGEYSDLTTRGTYYVDIETVPITFRSGVGVTRFYPK